MADKIDKRDSEAEGSNLTTDMYADLGRPYMQNYCVWKDLQFIMSPFMWD